MGVTAQVTTSAKFADLSNLTSGTYSVAVKDVAGGATQGKLTQNGVFSGTAGVSLVANATDNTVGNGTTTGLGAGTVSNGTHTLSISAYTAATTSVDGSVAFSLDGGATVTTTIAANTGIGASIDLGGGVGLKNTNSLAAFSASGSVSFDYIQKDTAKMQLQRSDGSAVAVDANNTDDYTAGPPVVNNTTSSVFYAKSGSNYDTGVGLTIKTGTLGNLQNSANTTVGTLNFQAKSNYTVDVSTAQKASDYMANVNTALDTVNKSMASLGSLMARLDFKSDSVSSAQTNVEASYNRIMNANMAEEQMNASKYSILQQTATAMLAQANQAPQSLLSLFR
jgi:flagellin